MVDYACIVFLALIVMFILVFILARCAVAIPVMSSEIRFKRSLEVLVMQVIGEVVA